MEQTRLPSIRLNAHQFRMTSEEQVRATPVLKPLLLALGSAPITFARSGTLGLGHTLARDERGRLWLATGQYDFRLYGFKDHSLARNLISGNLRQAA